MLRNYRRGRGHLRADGELTAPRVPRPRKVDHAVAHPSSETATRSVIDVSWPDLGLALGLILIAVGVSRRQGLGLAKDFLVGAIRTIVQLVLVGYVLVYIFAVGRWYVTVAALVLMLLSPRMRR